MILAIDIGNTSTKLALFSAEGKMLAHTALPSEGNGLPAVSPEWNADKAVIGSVVPALSRKWQEYLTPKFPTVHLCTHQSPWGFSLKIENPETVGMDRLLNLQAASRREGNVLVVDAGTATKFDLLEGTSPRYFPGGAIAPGLQISYDALLERTAQLPRIELEKFSPVVGYNTETAIRSGVLHGFAAQVDGMIAKIFEERKLPTMTSVIATGGNAKYLKGRARFVSEINPNLTLEGCYGIAQKI